MPNLLFNLQSELSLLVTYSYIDSKYMLKFYILSSLFVNTDYMYLIS